MSAESTTLGKSHATRRTVPRARRAFFQAAAQELAPRLLGCTFVRVLPDGTRLAGVIVETEAYLGPVDRACHTYKFRRTPRNEVMYARPGTLYVYFTYGMHFCSNVVCDEPVHGRGGAAVLLRALQPTLGQERMREFRGATARRETDLCSGPAKLCRAMALARESNGLDLTRSAEAWIEPAPALRERVIERTPRIGIDSAGRPWTTRLLRYLIREHPHASR